MDANDLKAVLVVAFFLALVAGGAFFTDYSIKQQRAGCIQMLKDRPAADILAVCK